MKLRKKGEATGRIEVALPASKSISNRILIMGALSDGAVTGTSMSRAEDTRLLTAALQTEEGTLHMGDAGTAIRFGLAWAALTPGERVLTGSKRLCRRPIRQLVEALQSLGADIEYLETPGFAPLKVRGKALEGGTVNMDASVSSQFISAMMLIAPAMRKGLTIALSAKRVSKPYVYMTASLMRDAGAEVELGENAISIAPTGYRSATIAVEPDWTSASYFYSVVALNPGLEVFMPGLAEDNIQGDSILTEVYRGFGVDTAFEDGGAVLRRTRDPEPGYDRFDFTRVPDIAQTVAVTAAALQREFTLTGLDTLRFKETDRIWALSSQLVKCGVHSRSLIEALTLEGHSPIPEGEVPRITTFGDHRMAMAFAPMVCALGAIDIEDPKVVGKSFPGFWEELAKMGVEMGD